MNAPHDHTAYSRAALDRECGDVAATRQGRNDRLNRAGFALGQLVGAGALDRIEVEARLFEAATANGHTAKHGPSATRATILSGMVKGEAEPRTLPQASRSNGASRPKPQTQPIGSQEPSRPKPKLSGVPIPDWTEPGEDGKPVFFAARLSEIRPLTGELRRHVYRRDGEATRLKIKKEGGWLDCYAVRRPSDGVIGWQARKPASFVPMPYLGPAGAIDGFDPELLSETLWWAEGEKDVDSLQRVGLAAFSFGSASDVPPCKELIRNRDVVVVGDNDEAGERGVERKVERARGVAARVRVVRFPELPVGGDASDFIEGGGNEEGLLERAEDVVANAPATKASGQERFTDAAQQPFVDPKARPSRPEPAKVNAMSAADLQGMAFPPIRYVVPGYIVEGCTLLVGAPKLGKSWMALEWVIAKATGGKCMGSINTGEAADTLYLALEDNYRRLQSRMDRLMLAGEKWPARLTLATEWPRANEGGLEKIREWARASANARLVVIDIFTMFRTPSTGKENAYEHDYQAVKQLQALAAELNIAIVIVHHTRKSRDQVDPFDRVSGTLGLSGAADAALILDRDGNGVTLYGRGRDIPEIETAMQFNKDLCRWTVLGRASEVRVGDERKVIAEALKVTDEPMSPITIADAVRLPRNNVKQLLFKMATAGEVVKIKRGLYVHPDRTDLLGTP